VLVVFVPGYTLDENVFEQYEIALADAYDTLVINPFIHSREKAFPSPEEVVECISEHIKEIGSTSVVLVGESLGFQIAMAATQTLRNVAHVFGLSPTLIPHNLIMKGPVQLQRFLSSVLLITPSVFFLPFVPFFCSPKGILFLRSIVGNYTYESKYLQLAVTGNSRAHRTFWQTMLEPLRVYVNRFTTEALNRYSISPHSITLLWGQSDRFITTALEQQYKGLPYHMALAQALGIAVNETVFLPGGHEGFLERLDVWLPEIIARIRTVT